MGAMHHQDEAMSRCRNAESDRLRESGSMEDEIKNDPWPGRMYNTLEQLGLLFINESVVDLDDRLVHAVMKLRDMADQSDNLPTALSPNAPSPSQPLPSLHERVARSSGLNPRLTVQCRLQEVSDADAGGLSLTFISILDVARDGRIRHSLMHVHELAIGIPNRDARPLDSDHVSFIQLSPPAGETPRQRSLEGHHQRM